ncbi:MAG: cupin-like domain-containing protein [Brevundimonas sp.]|nr:MAG: cupin-like domain-containing protein [Brevundimonas sp.]
MTPIREWRDVTAAVFQDIRRAGEPAVMRGVVVDWPLVRAARKGAAADYLRGLASEEPVPFMRAAPEVEGRLHYAEGAAGRNFTRETASLAGFLDQLEAEASKDQPDSLALQGLPAPERLAGFAERNPMPLLPPAILPRLWIGNAAKVAIHHDPSENVACVAVGRRRFTLFPPEAVGDLYMGPFHETPAGVQVSLVHLTDPDLERFPRFTRALEAAVFAELEPGDAIYIPYQWYHHVESLEPINVLVNYWWDAAPAGIGSPWDAMMHGMMSLRTLPADQRRAWKAMFDHYVFQSNGDPGAHLPEDRRGILSSPSAQSIAQMRKALLDKLRG